jgi:hypothetical protein
MLSATFTGKRTTFINPRNASRDPLSKMKIINRHSEISQWFIDNCKHPQMETNWMQMKEKRTTKRVFKWRTRL